MSVAFKHHEQLEAYIKNDCCEDVKNFISVYGIEKIISLPFGKNEIDFFNFACSSGAYKIASAVIAREIPVNIFFKDRFGYSTLYNVCNLIPRDENEQERYRKIIILLLEWGLDPNERYITQDRRFITPMSIFCNSYSSKKELDILTLTAMLRAGADLQTVSVDSQEKFVLFNLIRELDLNLLKLFLEFSNSVNVNFMDDDGCNMAHHLFCNTHSYGGLAVHCEIILLLCHMGLEVGNLNGSGFSALGVAVQNGYNSNIIECLTKLQSGMSALDVAAEMGYKEILEYMKNFKAFAELRIKQTFQFGDEKTKGSLMSNLSRSHCQLGSSSGGGADTSDDPMGRNNAALEALLFDEAVSQNHVFADHQPKSGLYPTLRNLENDHTVSEDQDVGHCTLKLISSSTARPTQVKKCRSSKLRIICQSSVAVLTLVCLAMWITALTLLRDNHNPFYVFITLMVIDTVILVLTYSLLFLSGCQEVDDQVHTNIDHVTQSQEQCEVQNNLPS